MVSIHQFILAVGRVAIGQSRHW